MSQTNSVSAYGTVAEKIEAVFYFLWRTIKLVESFQPCGAVVSQMHLLML